MYDVITEARREGWTTGWNEGHDSGWNEGRDSGWNEGQGAGQNLILTLMQRLFDAGRADDLRRASSDKAYLQQLLEEEGLYAQLPSQN